MHRFTHLAPACVLAFATLTGQAALPAPTPEQVAAQAAKKAAADAQAKLDQQALLAAMDAIAGRWRANARTHGWAVSEPVPVLAPIEALKAPADVKPAPAAGAGPAAGGVPVSAPASVRAPPKGKP